MNNITNYRTWMFVLAGISFIVFFSGLFAHILFLAAAIFLLFLGLTNFGRQCPLLLSLRYQIKRMKLSKSTNQSPQNKKDTV